MLYTTLNKMHDCLYGVKYTTSIAKELSKIGRTLKESAVLPAGEILQHIGSVEDRLTLIRLKWPHVYYPLEWDLKIKCVEHVVHLYDEAYTDGVVGWLLEKVKASELRRFEYGDINYKWVDKCRFEGHFAQISAARNVVMAITSLDRSLDMIVDYAASALMYKTVGHYDLQVQREKAKEVFAMLGDVITDIVNNAQEK